ncbi:type ISP restriction/modification enzyme [Campylobacter helveticus]|uniref:type ISP restriction/modification enzyme n=1 Tax=Campylobacter helveticus TaxID=28898 RepID=UPI00214A7185|nr:type ISP restriction/modification enzyme [Campylobacter helveticus]MCR2066044.1 hypothetical protein [Campylobacter helveticus]
MSCASGVETGKDNIAIQASQEAMEQVLRDLKELKKDEILKKYKLKSLDDGIISKTLNDKEAFISKIAYRPFDIQYTLYSSQKGFLRRSFYKIMQHLLKENLGLCFVKFGRDSDNASAFINNGLVERCQLVGHSGACSIAPLYLYINEEKELNFTQQFKDYKESHKILKNKSPEQILAFIYANLYNPKYRSKYLEYLKIGFPKVSFEVSVKEFERFEKLGSELIKLHLMQEIPQDEIDFEGECGEGLIEKRQESERFKEDAQKKGRIILNEKLSIIGISREVWDYTIGGYQVIKQWLKYRKEYQCSKDELLHLLKICKILNKILQIQKALDEI